MSNLKFPSEIEHAVLQTARYLSAHEDSYNFMSGKQPTQSEILDHTACGCPLAYIGYFLKLPRQHDACNENVAACLAMGYSDPIEFYEELDKIDEAQGWQVNRVTLVKVLREFVIRFAQD